MKISLRHQLIIVAAAALLFVPFLGRVHLFDWDEVNFAECAREMLVTGDYGTVRINYEPFWEKPPLFIWMQAASMELFGVSEFAARLPNALCGILTLLLLFRIGSKIYDKQFALLWVLAYAGSLMPHFYFKSGIIDPWFNLFIFLGIWRFTLYMQYAGGPGTQGFWNKDIALSALFIALAVLTKGPVALLVFGLCFVVWRLLKRAPLMRWKHFGLYVLAAGFVGGVWFLILAAQGRAHIIVDFIVYQIRLFNTEDAGHGGPFYYHWIVLLIGCFPASIPAIPGLFRGGADTTMERGMKRSMRVLFWVVLILFSIVKTKIVHYSSLCWFPLTYLAAYAAYKMINGQLHWKKWMSGLFIGIASVLALAFTLLPFIEQYKHRLVESALIKDPFAIDSLLRPVDWGGYEFVTGILLLLGAGSALWGLYRKRYLPAFYILFGATLVTTNLAALLLAPRVEQYSQAPAIRFFKEAAKQNVYSESLGYKSYAQFFYGRRQPGIAQNPLYLKWRAAQSAGFLEPQGAASVSENEIRLQREWMLRGEIDRPAWFACRNTAAEEMRKAYPHLKEVRREGGFVFFAREAGSVQ